MPSTQRPLPASPPASGSAQRSSGNGRSSPRPIAAPSRCAQAGPPPPPPWRKAPPSPGRAASARRCRPPRRSAPPGAWPRAAPLPTASRPAPGSRRRKPPSASAKAASGPRPATASSSVAGSRTARSDRNGLLPPIAASSAAPLRTGGEAPGILGQFGETRREPLGGLAVVGQGRRAAVRASWPRRRGVKPRPGQAASGHHPATPARRAPRPSRRRPDRPVRAGPASRRPAAALAAPRARSGTCSVGGTRRRLPGDRRGSPCLARLAGRRGGAARLPLVRAQAARRRRQCPRRAARSRCHAVRARPAARRSRLRHDRSATPPRDRGPHGGGCAQLGPRPPAAANGDAFRPRCARRSAGTPARPGPPAFG